MTELLYYHDAYRVEFKARVVERLTDDGRTGLVLDRTLFYPTSGGQPFDLGTLDGRAVEEVLVRETDEAVIHWLDVAPDTDQVVGKVDWQRRFDHMQQHTGQHILSQAFERVAGAATISFHMGADSSTLDLDVDELSQDQIFAAEQLANQIVWENRAVEVNFVTEAEAATMPLRKVPPAKDGMLRLVSVSSFDLSACGGTHVRQTGEVGMVKVIGSERQAGKRRIHFLCGRRALDDYDRKNLILTRLSNDLTTGYWQIENSVSRLRDDLKQANRQLKRKSEELSHLEAANLTHDATLLHGLHLIKRAFADRDPADLRRLAARLVAAERTVVLFGLYGPRSLLLFARSEDLELPVNDLLAKALLILGDASGGGSPKFAQGGGPAASEAQIERALAAAEELIHDVPETSPD